MSDKKKLKVLNTKKNINTKKNTKNNTKKKLIIIEALTFFLPLTLQKFIGDYYSYIHVLIMFMGLSIVLFSNNIFNLCSVLLILCLDGMANILFQDCPLSILEKKYYGMSMAELKQKIYSKLGINFKCSHVFESQLELIINVSCAVTLKILIVIFCNIFNIKIYSR